MSTSTAAPPASSPTEHDHLSHDVTISSSTSNLNPLSNSALTDSHAFSSAIPPQNKTVTSTLTSSTISSLPLVTRQTHPPVARTNHPQIPFQHSSLPTVPSSSSSPPPVSPSATLTSTILSVPCSDIQISQSSSQLRQPRFNCSSSISSTRSSESSSLSQTSNSISQSQFPLHSDGREEGGTKGSAGFETPDQEGRRQGMERSADIGPPDLNSFASFSSVAWRKGACGSSCTPGKGTDINSWKDGLQPINNSEIILGEQSSLSIVPFKIRDFGFPISSPLHHGIYPSLISPTSTSSDIENLFPCTARALYDFDAENPSELSFKEGQTLLVRERQYPGWLMAELREEGCCKMRIEGTEGGESGSARGVSVEVVGKVGLVPENYVCYLGE